jgi:hypothetical protein
MDWGAIPALRHSAGKGRPYDGNIRAGVFERLAEDGALTDATLARAFVYLGGLPMEGGG